MSMKHASIPALDAMIFLSESHTLSRDGRLAAGTLRHDHNSCTSTSEQHHAITTMKHTSIQIAFLINRQ
jgi:hypothetical protein